MLLTHISFVQEAWNLLGYHFGFTLPMTPPNVTPPLNNAAFVSTMVDGGGGSKDVSVAHCTRRAITTVLIHHQPLPASD